MLGCKKNQKSFIGDFPGSPVVKNLPCNTGDRGSVPGPGTNPTCCRATKPVPRTVWSPSATTTESLTCKKGPCLLQLRPDTAK